MLIVHYEVYVQESRGWMLHARFPRVEREEALKEAKELEQTLRIRTKVVRETYNTDNNAFDEAEVYLSGMIQKAAPARAAAGGGGRAQPARGGGKSAAAGSAAAARPGRSEAPRRGSSAKAASASGVVWRLLLIVLVGLAAALAAVRVTPEVIVFLFDFGFRVTPEGYGQLLFAVFVLTFLMVSVPLALRYLPRNAELTIKKPGFSWPQKDPRQEELKKSLDKLVDKARHEPPAPAAEEPPPVDEDILPEIRPDPEDEAAEALPEIRPDPEPEEKRKEEVELEAIADKAAAGPDVEALNVVCMRFLGSAINAMKAVTPTLDKFSKFALNLYMAGAVESMGEARRIEEPVQKKLLKQALETLGTSPDMAGRFYDRIGDYMGEPRYGQIIQSGRNAMDSWLAGEEATAHGALAQAMKDFNKPVGEKKPTIVTVMFTDMVGSTDLTQARGDMAAQEVVRRHNAIVRTALAQYAGKEIKHTGDGIMASFPSAGNAVEAAVTIQRQVAQFNDKQPDLGLHLRIGLNAGEPIQEEDDLFGTTVQLAARVCAATQTDEILCTQVVRDLSFGKTVTFNPAGEHALKGFKDKLPLFEVVWR